MTITKIEWSNIIWIIGALLILVCFPLSIILFIIALVIAA